MENTTNMSTLIAIRNRDSIRSFLETNDIECINYDKCVGDDDAFFNVCPNNRRMFKRISTSTAFKEVDGIYYINSKGDILNAVSLRIIASTCDEGYKVCTLRTKYIKPNGHHKYNLYRIAKIVMYVWGSTPPIGMVDPTIDHMNNIRDDNRIENLNWLTRSDNSKARTIKSRTFTDADILKITHMLLSGYSTSEIAKEVNSDRNTITTLIDRLDSVNGENLKDRLYNPAREQRINDAKTVHLKDIIDMYTDKHSTLSFISRKYAIPVETVREILIDNGITITSGRSQTSFTDKDIEEIIRLYTIEKLTTGTIGKIFGVKDYVIHDLLIRRNVKLRTIGEDRVENRIGRKYSLVEEDKICKEYVYDPYATCASLGKKYGVRSSTIVRWLKARNIEIRLPRFNVLTEEQEKTAIRLYTESHLMEREIAKMLNVDKNVIYRLFKREKIKTPSKSEIQKIVWQKRFDTVYNLSDYVFQQALPYFCTMVTPFTTEYCIAPVTDESSGKEYVFASSSLTPFDV